MLIERVREYLGVRPADSFQPALANRLDIDTSGLVLIAKSTSPGAPSAWTSEATASAALALEL